MVFITKGLDLILLFNFKNSIHFKSETKAQGLGGCLGCNRRGLARGGVGGSGAGRGEQVRTPPRTGLGSPQSLPRADRMPRRHRSSC